MSIKRKKFNRLGESATRSTEVCLLKLCKLVHWLSSWCIGKWSEQFLVAQGDDLPCATAGLQRSNNCTNLCCQASSYELGTQVWTADSSYRCGSGVMTVKRSGCLLVNNNNSSRGVVLSYVRTREFLSQREEHRVALKAARKVFVPFNWLQ